MIDNRLMDFVKMPYEAPSVTSLDILSEGLLCQSGFNYTEGGAGKYEDGDIFDNGEY